MRRAIIAMTVVAGLAFGTGAASACELYTVKVTSYSSSGSMRSVLNTALEVYLCPSDPGSNWVRNLATGERSAATFRLQGCAEAREWGDRGIAREQSDGQWELRIEARDPAGCVLVGMLPRGWFPIAGDWDGDTNQSGAPGGLAAPAAPDLTPHKTLQVANTQGPWGGTLTVPATDASGYEAGRCKLRWAYEVINSGAAPAAPPYADRLELLNGVDLATSAGVHLAPGALRKAGGEVLLPPGDHVLVGSVDDDLQVAESDEGNNRKRALVKVTGKCEP